MRSALPASLRTLDQPSMDLVLMPTVRRQAGDHGRQRQVRAHETCRPAPRTDLHHPMATRDREVCGRMIVPSIPDGAQTWPTLARVRTI